MLPADSVDIVYDNYGAEGTADKVDIPMLPSHRHNAAYTLRAVKHHTACPVRHLSHAHTLDAHCMHSVHVIDGAQGVVCTHVLPHARLCAPSGQVEYIC